MTDKVNKKNHVHSDRVRGSFGILIIARELWLHEENFVFVVGNTHGLWGVVVG